MDSAKLLRESERDRMSQFVDILDAFESALALERELGTLTAEIDPAILRGKIQVAKEVPPRVEAAPSSPIAPPVPPSVPPPVKRVVQEPSSAAVPVDRGNATPPDRGCLIEGKREKPDFLFITEKYSLPAAETLFKNMVAAIGYSLSEVCVIRVNPSAKTSDVAEEALLSKEVKSIAPRVIFIFGESVVFSLFPGRNLRRNTWEMYNDIPVVVTHSPEKIEKFNMPNNVRATIQSKTEVWNILKSGLSKINKEPPQR